MKGLDEVLARQMADSLVRCVRLLRRLGQGENPVVESAERRLRIYETGPTQPGAVPGDLMK